MLSIFLTHIFLQAYEKDIAILPEILRDKIRDIPELLSGSRASSTVKVYFRSFKKWSDWLKKNGLENDKVSSTKPLTVSIYLASLIQEGVSVNVLTSALYGIRWAHSVIGVTSPTESELVKNVFEAGKRKLAIPRTKKEPISAELLKKMYNKFFHCGNVYNQRSICACLIAYAGFLRSSELLNIRCSDVTFEKSHMSIFIEKSKTDIYRDGQWVVIARTDSDVCPVKNLELFMRWCEFSEESTDFIFCNLSKIKTGYKVRKGNKALTYSRLRELFIEVFKDFVPDISKFGLHSLRAGGATVCANSGIPDRLFKRHGRWKSESAKDGYVKDRLESRLLVSLNLGL